MNMEEIVALSVKHNVSDLHLCSAWPARWRIRGLMEAAPFDAPDVEELLREWLDDDQRAILLENGQLCCVAGGKPAVAWQCVRATARYFSGITVVTFALSTARTAWRTTGIAGITQEREWPDSGDGGDGVNPPRWRHWLAILINMLMRIF